MIKKLLNKFLIFFLTLLAYLPFPVLYLISDGLYVFVYHIFGYRIKVVRKNLIKSFPQKTNAERKEIEQKFYHHFCDLIIETIKLIQISSYSLSKRLVIENPEILEKFYKKQQSILFITNHYNNWEWAGTAVSATSKFKIYPIYKPLTNRYFDEFIKKIRGRFGAVPLAKNDTLRTLVANKYRLTGTAFIGDQSPVKQEIQYWTQFLNQETPMFLGVEKIAVKFGYPVIYGHVEKLSRGYYQLTFKVLTENPSTNKLYDITELHLRELESAIQKKPEFWLWSHNRWKHTKPEALETNNDG